MIEKRVVTKDRNGEVVKTVEHHDLTTERKERMAQIKFAFLLGIFVAGIVLNSLARYRF